MKLSEAWRERWAQVFAIDLRTLALFRVAFASVLLVDTARRCLDLTAFHTDAGVLPRDWLIQSDSAWRLDLYLISGDAWFAALLLGLTLLAALMLWLGWRARLASVALFVLVGSLQNRNPMVLIGGDSLVMCLLFWSMFLPLSARWSVDAALSAQPPPENHRHLSWASAGTTLQVLSVYFFSAVLKNGADWWPDGLAVYYTMELERYATPLGRELAQFPSVMHALSYYVYFLEWSGPLLALSPVLQKPLRFAAMLMFIAMHIGFIFFLEIGHFPYVSLASLTLLLGGWFWDWRARAGDRGRRIRIYYDRDCGFCLKTCKLFETFLVLPHADIQPAQDWPRPAKLMELNNSWVVIDDEDVAHLKWDAFVALVRHSRLFGGLHRLLRWPLWEKPGVAAYDFVARHRPRFAAVSAWLLPERSERFETGRGAQRVACAFLFAVLAWNLSTVGALPPQIVDLLRGPFRVLRIDQLWNMFAPYPSRADGWVVFPGKLEDGSDVDVLRPGQPLSWDKPRYISQTHENIRWHTYRWRIWEKQYSQHRLYYGRYLCREWNRAAPPGKRLVKFNMTWVQEFSVPPGQTPKVERAVGWWHECLPAGNPPPDNPAGVEKSGGL